MRYRLDELGCHLFEDLIQTLLKASLGLGVESWGGRGDWGRDSYCKSPLPFPSKDEPIEGPFIFQVKFIENANAPGSKCDSLLKDAVRKEMSRIREHRKHGRWQEPRHYTLITNATPSAKLRTALSSMMGKELASSETHVHGGSDVAGMLDEHPQIRSTFPQLLSIGDLKRLIEAACSRVLTERTDSAIKDAEEIAAVFVPTAAYRKAWAILNKHHFVVLEGPPEMGKTAIRWVIALALATQGWEIIDCSKPEDFFQGRRPNAQQVFVADDAFGRTEYNVSRIRPWEQHLHRIYRLLDRKHWLIWTSRRHILERARRDMDLQGQAQDFPNPGAVVVDASQLTDREKALILYRHARSAGLEAQAKNLIRQYARKIVAHAAFTPLRIQRFVKSSLPQVVADLKGEPLTEEKLRAKIHDSIQAVTESMRLTFKSLPEGHKRILFSLVESTGPFTTDELEKRFLSYYPGRDDLSFTGLLEELSEAFIKLKEYPFAKGMRFVDWVHPSFRDLVIDELTTRQGTRIEFLQRATLEGLGIAISEAGGALGDRVFPLLNSQEDWNTFRKRCRDLVDEDVNIAPEILEKLSKACSYAPTCDHRVNTTGVLGELLLLVREKWDESGTVISSFALEKYVKASLCITPLPSLPHLPRTWDAAAEELRGNLDSWENYGYEADYSPELWIKLTKVIKTSEPRFLQVIGFPQKYEGEIVRILDLAGKECALDPIADSSGELRSYAGNLTAIRDAVTDLAGLDERVAERATALGEVLAAKIAETEEHAEQLEMEEAGREERDRGWQNEEDGAYRGTSGAPEDYIDIERLFSDL